jgi:hypothetical protein
MPRSRCARASPSPTKGNGRAKAHTVCVTAAKYIPQRLKPLPYRSVYGVAERHSLTKIKRRSCALHQRRGGTCESSASRGKAASSRPADSSGTQKTRRHFYEKARSRRFAKDAILRYQGMFGVRARAGQAPAPTKGSEGKGRCGTTSYASGDRTASASLSGARNRRVTGLRWRWVFDQSFQFC